MGREIWAEQALLGAVLSDPPGQQGVLDLVEREDMRRPWHGQVLAAMQRLRDRGVLPGPAEVYAELRKDPDLPASVSADAVPLISLMQAAPRAAHATAYAGMVVDGGIRQWLALAGSRMTQAAEESEGEPLEASLRMAEAARREIAACRARWEALPEAARRIPPGPVRSARDLVVARRVTAIRAEIARLRRDLQAGVSVGAGERLGLIARQLGDAAAVTAAGHERQPAAVSGTVRPSGPAAEAADAAALRELAAAPSQIGAVGDWLNPEDFARPEHGELYAVMRDLDAAGVPVDPVTITWEAARSGRITLACSPRHDSERRSAHGLSRRRP